MKLRIPLPWYSKQSYDICMDEYRGGWRFLFIAIEINKHPSAPKYSPLVGFQFGFRVGFGVRFSPVDLAVRE